MDLETGGYTIVAFVYLQPYSRIHMATLSGPFLAPMSSHTQPCHLEPKATEVQQPSQITWKNINADAIEIVWPTFVSAAEAAIGNDGRQGIIVAWNGKSCDMEWIYRITHGRYNLMRLPKNCHLFMDPYAILNNYKGCLLSKNKGRVRSK